MSSHTKDDVETHNLYRYGKQLPAVNVKVYGDWLKVDLTQFHAYTGDGFTREWLEDNVEDSLWNDAFETACQDGWDNLQGYADDVWSKREYGSVKVWSAGRSGGWVVVEGLSDVEGWDAVMLAKWRKFERLCKAESADVPYKMIDFIAYNVYPVAEADYAAL